MSSISIEDLINIDEVLNNFNIFLTGASGFVGCVILQKLLSVANQDGQLFLLMRSSRKHGSIEQRLRNQVLTQPIFDLTKEMIEDLLITEQRIVAVEGDLTSPRLGLTEKDLNLMKFAKNGKPVLVIHCAADVDFNREINQSININVNGTFQCIQVAQQIDAKAFLHISTLYVNSREQTDNRIMERIYDSGFNAVEVFDNWLNKYDKHFTAEQVNSLLKSKCPANRALLQKDWPNHYTLTKNITEKVVLHYCNQYEIPTSIARLGIVSPIRDGPHRGWFMGSGGFVFIAIGQATGNIRYLQGDGEGRPDFIPVDYTVNAIMAILARMGHAYLQCTPKTTAASKVPSLENKEEEALDITDDSNPVANTDNTNTSTASGPNSNSNSDNSSSRPHFDASSNGTVYQIGVVAVDESWNFQKLTDYVVPNWHTKNLPNSPKDAGAVFIRSAVLFFIIELVLYDIPLYFVSIFIEVLKTMTFSFWYSTWYKFVGVEYDFELYSLRNYHQSSKQQEIFNTATQIRSIQMQLLSASSSYLRKLQFMINARGKLKWFHSNYTFFVNQKWTFDHSNVKELFSSLESDSQTKYDFDINNFDIHEYCLDVAVKCYLKWLDFKKTRRVQYKEHTSLLNEKLSELQGKLESEFRAKFPTQEEQFVRTFRNLWVFNGLGYKWFFAIAITAVIGLSIFLCV